MAGWATAPLWGGAKLKAGYARVRASPWIETRRFSPCPALLKANAAPRLARWASALKPGASIAVINDLNEEFRGGGLV